MGKSGQPNPKSQAKAGGSAREGNSREGASAKGNKSRQGQDKGRARLATLAKLRSRRMERLRELSTHVWFQAALFTLFVLTMVGLVILGVGADRGIESVEAGDVAPHDLKATRDFVFSERDQDTLEREREAAARRVAHVYDWQEGLGEDIRTRIADAFSSMRAALAATIRVSLASRDPERLSILERDTEAAQLDEALIQLASANQRVALTRELRSEHFDSVLGITLRESDLDTFARVGFPAHAESALGAVVGDVMTRIIVPSRRILESGDEAGVYLRRLLGDRVNSEYRIANVESQVVPLERVPALVDEVGANRLLSIGDRELRSAIAATATVLVQPNTTYNPVETSRKREEAADAVEDRVLREEFRKGQVIVDQGHVITDRSVRILQQMQTERELLSVTQVVAGVVFFALLLTTTMFLFGRRNIRTFSLVPRDLVFVCVTLLLGLLITRVGLALALAIVEQTSVVALSAWYYAIPVAAVAMLVRIVLNSETAIVVTVLFAALTGLMADHSLFFSIYTAIGGLVGATSVRTVKNRMGLLWSGVNVAAVNAALVVTFLLLEGQLITSDPTESLMEAAFFVSLAMMSGIASGFVASVVLPIVESVFGYTTDIKLLELSNLNHPALRELIMLAPGSYHHSMMVGSLCEAAAEAIGCNALLARVGSYYHDIGKTRNPLYFAENQRLGENPHDRLKPNISALVIKAHVKDGLEMARQYRLPQVIQDFVVQHHGTSLIRYFYHKARQLEDPDIPEVVEEDYRYPGPKPQTRETAICLLADGIEAASRAMPEPTPTKLRQLVEKMVNTAFTDGQLDECDLTLKDLSDISDAFHRILTGIYHHRPQYPGPDRAQLKQADKRDGADQDAKPREGTSAKATSAKTNKPREGTSAKGNKPREGTSAKGNKPDESKRQPVRTGPLNTTQQGRTLIPTPAATDSLPEIDVPRANEESGEWEITQQQRDELEGDLNASRHHRGGDSAKTPANSSTNGEDSGKDRASLPHSGSSGSGS